MIRRKVQRTIAKQRQTGMKHILTVVTGFAILSLPIFPSNLTATSFNTTETPSTRIDANDKKREVLKAPEHNYGAKGALTNYLKDHSPGQPAKSALKVNLITDDPENQDFTAKAVYQSAEETNNSNLPDIPRYSILAALNDQRDLSTDHCTAEDLDEIDIFFADIDRFLIPNNTVVIYQDPQSSAEDYLDVYQIPEVFSKNVKQAPEYLEQSPKGNNDYPQIQKTKIKDIPLYTNRRIKGFIRIYTHSKRYVFEKAIARSATYLVMIRRIFREHGLPQNLAYLAVVESNFNPNARSKANAVGLWQFMSYTGRSFGLERSWWHDERYDPEKSTIAAAKFLKHLHKRFKGNWELALAAYNSGSGRVRRALRKAKLKGKPLDFWSLKLPRETRGYVPAFFAVATIFEDLEKYGFSPASQLMDMPAKKAIIVAGGIPLQQIAEVLKIDYATIRKFNPSIRLGGLTPAVQDTYSVSVPVSAKITADQFTALEALKAQRYKSWKYHTVKKGETLWSISRNYRIPIKKIVKFNRFRRKNLIRVGQKLILPVPTDYSPPIAYSKTNIIKKSLDKLPGITWVHKVRKGDTLWRISQIYKVPLSKLKHWNRIALRKRILSIGTEIVLKLPHSGIDSRI